MPSVQSILSNTPHDVPLRDRELLLAHVLGKPREWVIAHPETPMRPAMVARYRRLLRRLERGEPLPYLMDEHWFYGRPFTVNRNVLIPRPETETMIELALDRIRNQESGITRMPTIIDVGTGSGCIAVTLAAELYNAHIIATDASPAALRVARTNARRNGVADRIMFLRRNLLEPSLRVISRAQPENSHTVHRVRSLDFAPAGRSARDDTMVTVLANLPYLTTAEWHALPKPIKDYEPRQALDGGPDGLRYYRTLFVQLARLTAYGLPAPRSLGEVGRLTVFLEIDPRRKRALSALVRKTLPKWGTLWHRDLAGRWRVLEIQGPTVTVPAGPASEARSR